ncbi:unnamed protein product, partial [marine sediment metagenome]
VLLPDIAGDEIKGLTRAVGKLTGGKNIITDALEGRSNSAVTRVSNQLAKDVSSVDSYFVNLDDLSKARSIMATPFYKKAFDKGTILDLGKKTEDVVTESFSTILGRQIKTTKGAILTKDQRDNVNLLKKIAPDIRDARSKFRMGDDIPNNSLIMLDAAKKTLDDKIGVAIRQGEKQQSMALLEIKSELVNKLDDLNPDYKKARQIFSDFSTIENSQKQGLEFSKLRPEEIRRYMKNLTVSEKEAFRIGVRENLQKTVSSTATGADPAKRIFGSSFKEGQLKAVFPNEIKFKQFKKRMLEEVQAAKTKFEVLGGSRTDINLAAETEFLNTIAQAGGGLATGGKLPLINAAVSSIKNKFGGISEKNAKRLATILVNKKESINLLEKFAKKEKNQVQKDLIG